jgi:hypothetical protein
LVNLNVRRKLFAVVVGQRFDPDLQRAGALQQWPC